MIDAQEKDFGEDDDEWMIGYPEAMVAKAQHKMRCFYLPVSSYLKCNFQSYEKHEVFP